VIYVAVDRKDSEPILKEFERQTGIRVRAVYDAEAAKTTGLVARLLGESSNPRCDVFWNNEIAQTVLLADRGLLAEYRSAAAEDIPPELKDPAGRWTAVATRCRVLVYNTRYVSADEVPRSLAELTQPRWRGKVAMADPQFGTTRTHVATLYACWGAERTQAFLEDLLDNQVRIVDGNAMVKNLVARAKPDASPVYVGLTDTDDVLAGQAEGQPIDMVYPDQDGDGTLVIPSAVSLVRGGPNPEAGRRLVDYLVSRGVESQITAKGTGYTSVRTTPASGDGPVRAMPVSYQAISEQLTPSSEWTAEHFHP
jgi:iron(III) transport system substrate-binding protein